MRKASSIKDFDELLISNRAVDLLRKKSDTLPVSIKETDPLMRVILWGRQMIPTIKKRSVSQYMVELLKALNDLDLFRRDFSSLTLNIGRFYQDVFFGETTPHLVYFLSDFHTNEDYETYRCANWGDRVSVMGAIQNILEDSDSAYAVANYYGIDDGYSYFIKDIAKNIEQKPSTVYNRFKDSMDKIREHKNQLPELFGIENRVKTTIDPSKRPYYAYGFMENMRNHDKTGKEGLKLLAKL